MTIFDNILARTFRLRWWLYVAIFALGFLAPWTRLNGQHPGTTWLFLSGVLSEYRILPIGTASIAVIAAAFFCILLAALLRTWGAAYLGSDAVQHGALQGERVVADGPYRHTRNPLYVGNWLHALALSVLMPPGGALFTVIAITLLQFALVRAEEQHLIAQRGDAYANYLRAVPRFLPGIGSRIASGSARPHWGQAFAGEIYMWGAALTFAVCAMRYNVTLIEQGVLISLGVSIVVRGAFRRKPARA